MIKNSATNIVQRIKFYTTLSTLVKLYVASTRVINVTNKSWDYARADSHVSASSLCARRPPSPVSLVGRMAMGSASSVLPDLVTQAT